MKCLIIIATLILYSNSISINSGITLAKRLPTQIPLTIPKNSLQDSVIEFIKSHEGFKAKPYYCSGGQLTIGYGTSVINYRKFTKDTSLNITENKGNIALKRIFNYCKDYVTKKIIRASEGQILAISHLAYCLGTNHKAVTKIINYHNKGNIDISYWLYIGGKQSAKYRFFELSLYTHTKKMFLSANMPYLHRLHRIKDDVLITIDYPHNEVTKKNIINSFTINKLIVIPQINNEVIYKNPQTSMREVKNILENNYIDPRNDFHLFFTFANSNLYKRLDVITKSDIEMILINQETDIRDTNSIVYENSVQIKDDGRTGNIGNDKTNFFFFRLHRTINIGLVL